jgi:hypothetical protein
VARTSGLSGLRPYRLTPSSDVWLNGRELGGADLRYMHLRTVGPDESPYAAAVRALLEDGPMQGKTVEVEAVEGRPPKTIDVPDEKGGTCRYCLAQWTQEGMTAAYTFLYAV